MVAVLPEGVDVQVADPAARLLAVRRVVGVVAAAAVAPLALVRAHHQVVAALPTPSGVH